MPNIGFTGTREGMNVKQLDAFHQLLDKTAIYSDPHIFHHGDCIGADEQAAAAAKHRGFWIICHPPILSMNRAFVISDTYRTPRTFLERNKDIVDESQYLIAASKTMGEELRSGTWATIRYARKKNKPIYIILPDGSVNVQALPK